MEPKPCGLITFVPPALQNEWAANLAGFAKRFRPAALIFEAPAAETLAQAVAAAKPFELAVLSTGNAAAARVAGADGLYLSATPGAGILEARAALGSAAVIGVACGLSRHAAMESAEAGADFVSFDAPDAAAWDQAAGLSAWWDEMTGVPAALAFGSTRPDKTVLSKARPDFLLIEETVQAGESLTFATEFGLQSQM
jgi:thiamine-phosphate pyrophosphorylase